MVVKHEHEVIEKRNNKFKGEGGRELHAE